jgi:hypothetical protein
LGVHKIEGERRLTTRLRRKPGRKRVLSNPRPFFSKVEEKPKITDGHRWNSSLRSQSPALIQTMYASKT